MEISEAVKILSDLIVDSPSETFEKFKGEIEKKKYQEFAHLFDKINYQSFAAANFIKDFQKQISEVVHAIGMITLLPKILHEDEIVEHISLASGADKSGFDLVTNIRIAEFKFGRAPKNKLQGMRRRTFCSDYLGLIMYHGSKKKYFYLQQPEIFEAFIKGKSQWEKVLTKNQSLQSRFRDFLREQNSNAVTVKQVYEEFDNGSIEIMNINTILDMD